MKTLIHWRQIIGIIICICTTISNGQDTTIRPTPSALKSVQIMTEKAYDLKKTSLGEFYNILHMDKEKVKIEFTTSRPTKPVHFWSCGVSASVQQKTAEIFAPYADVYSYLAFRFTSQDKPKKGELIWGNLDNPFINHARRMRHIIGDIPIIACLPGNVGNRAISLEEIRWQFIASLGCGYRGIVWYIKNYKDVLWGAELKELEKKICKYSRDLAHAKPIDWVSSKEDQAITALASEKYLFIFVLNKAYMNLGNDGKTVFLPLEKTLCESNITITLPVGLEVRRGRTLAGNSLRIIRQNDKTMSEYSFNAGGEMLIYSLEGRIELPDATQSLSQPAALPAQPVTTQPTSMEHEQR